MWPADNRKPPICHPNSSVQFGSVLVCVDNAACAHVRKLPAGMVIPFGEANPVTRPMQGPASKEQTGSQLAPTPMIEYPRRRQIACQPDKAWTVSALDRWREAICAIAVPLQWRS